MKNGSYNSQNLIWKPKHRPVTFQLKALEEYINAHKNQELMMAQDKPSDNHLSTRLKPFKQKFNNKLRKNASFQKHQSNVMICLKYRKPGYIQKSCKLKMKNDRNYNNNQKPRQDRQKKR